MNGLSVENLHKSFGETQALAGVSFQVAQGEIVAVLGPSGCGKSTLLGIIAGLMPPDQGQLLWNGAPLGTTPPHLRGFGLMFQDLALFPHRDVFENVAFGLQMSQGGAKSILRRAGARQSQAQIRERVGDVLELVGLPSFEDRDVNTLSGGEGQRVALARSLAPRPRLLMLDEPLGSLDRNLRERLVLDLRKILHDSEQTALYVTHDQEEAFVIADRVVIMNAGMVEQIGTPRDIYRYPACAFVARFLGLTNLLEGEMRICERGSDLEKVLHTPLGDFPWHSHAVERYPATPTTNLNQSADEQRPADKERPADKQHLKDKKRLMDEEPLDQNRQASAQQTRVTVLLRPDAVYLDSRGTHQISGMVEEITFRGSTCRAAITVNSLRLTFDFPSNIASSPNANLPPKGEQVTLSFDPTEALQVFPLNTARRI